MLCVRTLCLVLVLAASVGTLAFLPMAGPKIGGPSPYRLFSAKSERTASSLHSSRRPMSLRMSENVLEGMVASKQKVIDELKANPPPGVAERLEAMSEANKPKKQPIFKALKKPKGTITVMPQMKFKTPKLGKFCEPPEADILSSHYYEAGAAAITCTTDEELFGFTLKDLATAKQVQDKKKGEFPSPLPVLAYDVMLDPIQLAEAAEAGAQGVFLNVAALGERTKEMGQAAEQLGLEWIAEVHSEEEIQTAADAECKIFGICNRDMATWDLISPVDAVLRDWTTPIEETVFALGDKVPAGCLKVAMGNVNETLMAWKLRDAGYNCVMIGETLMRGSEMRMASGPYQSAYNEAKGLIKAFRSKGSVKYGPSSTASFYGKGEGAKETLGIMSM
mmetsp:Transcript_12124/g.30374  ORF Transcript_12124/g.30374 Transcript_12124/m.30374 type:complete len:392 (+) Transcript_12124:46-1221(+)